MIEMILIKIILIIFECSLANRDEQASILIGIFNEKRKFEIKFI